MTNSRAGGQNPIVRPEPQPPSNMDYYHYEQEDSHMANEFEDEEAQLHRVIQES